MATTVKSSCSLNCWDNCGFVVTVEDGKVKSVQGDPEHPITKGKICGRGRMLETRTNSSERLLYPLKKVNGVFMQISWEQALTEIADKMAEIKATSGPLAILHSHDYANGGLLTNLDQRFFNSLGGVTELVGSICWGAGIEAQKWDFGNAYAHSPDDIENSNHVVIWGRNVSRTNMHLFSKLQEAKKRGAKIVVIDPIFNATAKIADAYYTVKPGMDGILAVGIMKVLLEKGWEAKDFIEKHTIGYSDLEELLHSITLEEVSKLAEVPVATIEELADVYRSGPTMTYLGLGMQRYQNGGNTIRLIDALVAISGNVGIPGGGANYGNLQVGQSFSGAALTLPERKQYSRTITMMEQGKAIQEATNPGIEMIVVTCGNPLTQVPNTNEVRKAFESVNTVVVLEQFMTETAELADYVLPVATVFEQEDLYYSSMYHHYVNYGPKLVEAPGEAKSDMWVWTELANRLGFGEVFAYTREEFINMGIRDLTEKGFSLETLKETGHLPLPVQDVPWSDFTFQTPSGKYEFTASLGYEKGFNGKLTLSLPMETINSTGTYPYTLLTIHPGKSNHSQHYLFIEALQSVKVEISKDIAEEKGLANGDSVRVWNDRGEITGIVKIMDRAHPKTINIDEGQWAKFGGSVNALTPHHPSDNGLGSTIYDCVVAIEKMI